MGMPGNSDHAKLQRLSNQLGNLHASSYLILVISSAVTFAKAIAENLSVVVRGCPLAATLLHAQPDALESQKRKNLPCSWLLGRGCDNGGEGGSAGWAARW